MMHHRQVIPDTLSRAVRTMLGAVTGRVPASERGTEHSPETHGRGQGAASSIVESSRVQEDAALKQTLRAWLGTQRGGENLEFLLSCKDFELATNALQRFQLLQWIFHRFVSDHAPRPLNLSQACRRILAEDWLHWSTYERIHAGVRLPGLQAAVAEVRLLAANDPRGPCLADFCRL